MVVQSPVFAKTATAVTYCFVWWVNRCGAGNLWRSYEPSFCQDPVRKCNFSLQNEWAYCYRNWQKLALLWCISSSFSGSVDPARAMYLHSASMQTADVREHILLHETSGDSVCLAANDERWSRRLYCFATKDGCWRCRLLKKNVYKTSISYCCWQAPLEAASTGH